LRYAFTHPPKISTFDLVVGLAWSNDPEISTGSSLAAGRVPQVRQVKGDDPGKKKYPGPPGRGLSEGLMTPHFKNIYCCEDPNRRPRSILDCSASLMMILSHKWIHFYKNCSI
jgi:hypothetical protein